MPEFNENVNADGRLLDESYSFSLRNFEKQTSRKDLNDGIAGKRIPSRLSNASKEPKAVNFYVQPEESPFDAYYAGMKEKNQPFSSATKANGHITEESPEKTPGEEDSSDTVNQNNF